jgi:hypothetical protein
MPAKAFSTKGLQIWLGNPEDPVPVVPTAISKAAPAVVTVANTAVAGDLAYISGSGFPELDGRWFPIGAPTATQFELVGSDTTLSAGALGTTPAIEVHAKGEAFDLSCISKAITFNSDAPATIQAGTFCDPSLAITSPIIPATTIEFGGNINIADPAYKELIDASLDGLERPLDILLPSGQGDIVAPAVVSLVTWDLPVDGVQGFTATVTCSSRPMHLF